MALDSRTYISAICVGKWTLSPNAVPQHAPVTTQYRHERMSWGATGFKDAQGLKIDSRAACILATGDFFIRRTNNIMGEHIGDGVELAGDGSPPTASCRRICRILGGHRSFRREVRNRTRLRRLRAGNRLWISVRRAGNCLVDHARGMEQPSKQGAGCWSRRVQASYCGIVVAVWHCGHILLRTPR